MVYALPSSHLSCLLNPFQSIFCPCCLIKLLLSCHSRTPQSGLHWLFISPHRAWHVRHWLSWSFCWITVCTRWKNKCNALFIMMTLEANVRKEAGNLKKSWLRFHKYLFRRCCKFQYAKAIKINLFFLSQKFYRISN